MSVQPSDAYEGDTADGRFSQQRPAGDAPAGDAPAMTIDEPVVSQYVYNMSHLRRGMAIIINNRVFRSTTGQAERTGTDIDAARLYELFYKLGFDAHIYNNQTTGEMLDIVTKAGAVDHTECDAFVLCILSHGDQGLVYGVDGVITIDILTSCIKGDRCLSLAGKPKLFFIQACRGNYLDHGVEVADAVGEEDEPVRRIPAEADFLMAYSTVPGYYSWRNSTRGSWFVQALEQVFNDPSSKGKDILSLMTRVNYLVAFNFESNASREFMNQKKQVPSIVSMLTKDLYLSFKK